MKMVASADDPRPTICGILILGRHPRDYLPGAYVQFLRIAGTALDSPIVDERLFDGPIGPLIGSLEDKLDSHNRTAVDVTSATLETRASTYAPVALRQLVRNAVMHRSYEGTNSPIHVYWYDDRIEINSPGGAYGEVSAENFGQAGFRRLPQPAGSGGDASARPRAAMGIGIAHRAARAARQPASGPAVQRHAAAHLLYRTGAQCRAELKSHSCPHLPKFPLCPVVPGII